MDVESLNQLEDIELRMLLESVYQHYGYDFRDYSYPSVKRRVARAMKAENLSTISALQDVVLHKPDAMERLLTAVSVNVTAMFRNPSFYRALRTNVVPLLRTYPFFRIWIAGCSSGEEAYSMAILMEEEGLYDRCRIYATDLTETVVGQAQTGIFGLPQMRDYSANYIQAGGKGSLSEYFTAKYDGAIIRSSLKRNLVFARHNLATDSSFNLFHVILCRNVMIYFNETLSNRVHKLLYDSLLTFGVLGLGSMESTRFTQFDSRYEEIVPFERIYRKTGPRTSA